MTPNPAVTLANPGYRHRLNLASKARTELTQDFDDYLGYQPTAVVWAEHDLVVVDQFRDGDVPAGMDTREVAKAAVTAVPAGVQGQYFPGDSASYDEKLLKYLVGEKIRFTVSADMTQALRRECGREPLDWARLEDPRQETVDLAEIEFTPGDWPTTAAPLRYIALRIRSAQGTLFEHSPKYQAVVSNRKALNPEQLVRWH